MDTFYYGTVNCIYKLKKKKLKWKGNHLISIFTPGRQRALTASRKYSLQGTQSADAHAPFIPFLS